MGVRERQTEGWDGWREIGIECQSREGGVVGKGAGWRE